MREFKSIWAVCLIGELLIGFGGVRRLLIVFMRNRLLLETWMVCTASEWGWSAARGQGRRCALRAHIMSARLRVGATRRWSTLATCYVGAL